MTALAMTMARTFQRATELDRQAAISGYRQGRTWVDPRIAFAALKIRCHMLSNVPAPVSARVRRYDID